MLKLMKSLSRKDVLIILACIFMVTVQVFLELKLPDFMSNITVLVETEGSKMSDILAQGGHMLICAFLSLITAIIICFLSANLSASVSYNLRDKIFNHVESLGMNEIKKFQTSSLITRTTNDVTQIEMLISFGLQALVKAPIMAIWAVTKILNKNLYWSLITLGCVVLLTVINIVIITKVTPRFKVVQKLIDNVNSKARENLTGIRVVHAFNAESYVEDRFDGVNNDLTQNHFFVQKTLAIIEPIIYLVMNFLTLGIYFMGALLISKTLIPDRIDLFSNMVVFTSYGIQVIASFLMLTMLFMILPRANVSANRINEILDCISSIKDGKKTNVKDKGTIEFKNVKFKYPESEEYILEDISFKVNKGETVAFIGSTGSGKSTLINLVPRFYDVTEGSILVDDVDVRDYKLYNLNEKIGYIPQKAVMFDGSVNYNVSYGPKKINKNKVKEAVKVAQAKSFVEKMDKDYDSHIARGGSNISGGQKQRLSIARAIYKNPEIYIFDDTFSALDYKTDLKLRTELKKYTKNSTILIVAQRIGTIINCDKIVVLDKGKIVGIGTHKELLKSCKVYKEIALSQLSKEELDA